MLTLAHCSPVGRLLFMVVAGAGIVGPAASCTKEPAATQAASRPVGTTTSATATMPAIANSALNDAQRAAAQRMVAAAAVACQELRKLEALRPRTPEFFQLKLSTLRLQLDVQLLLLGDGPQRTTALQDYLKAAQQAYKEIKAREAIDATIYALNLAAFSLAEAEYLVAGNGTLPTARTPEQQSIAQRMTQTATSAFQGIRDIEDIRPRTPEFFQLRLEACRRICDAGLLLNPAGAPRQKLVDDYLAQARQCNAEVLARRDIDATTASIAMADYALADAELLATAPGTRTAAPADAVAHLLAAAQRANEGLLQLHDIRPHSPEWWALRREWMQKLLQAKLLSHPLPADRRRDLEEYATSARQMTASIKLRAQIDATPADIALADYAEAQADFWLAADEVK